MLKVTHFLDSGFFSCCSVKAHEIIAYFNVHKCLPLTVDSSTLFLCYKPDTAADITFDFFKPCDNDIAIHYTELIDVDMKGTQFQPYRDLPYDKIIPFIRKYFTPSDKILSLSESLIEKYAIDTSKCIGLYYRGTDKYTETNLASFDSFYTKLKEVAADNDHTQILLQSDSQPFLDYINERRSDIAANIIIIAENTASYTKFGIHHEHTQAENYLDIQNFFATLIILAKCKYFICSSGNCSIWAVYFKENAQNVYQVLNNIWV